MLVLFICVSHVSVLNLLLRFLSHHTGFPANMRRWPNVGLLLAHRLRRWPNSKPTLGQRLMFAGLSVTLIYYHWERIIMIIIGSCFVCDVNLHSMHSFNMTKCYL